MRVSEIYASTQGEGPNVGRVTVFLRFGGCNLRCPGWPCDTQHAIDPAYRKQWEQLAPEELSQRVDKVADLVGARCVTLTGGEPFLQPNDELRRLMEYLGPKYDVDCFSNGTLLYPLPWTKAIQFIMDWKLPGSGEQHMNDNRLNNLWTLDAAAGFWQKSGIDKPQSVKFVCKDETDFYKATELYYDYLSDKRIRVYVGKVWDGEITDAQLAELVMRHQLPWYLNIQMHNYIWPANERGR